MGTAVDDHALIARVGSLACAIPIARVVETMRPLPIEPVGDGPPFIRGIAIVRGAPTVVVDMARLLGRDGIEPRRFVTVRAGDRTIALAFEGVVGVRRLARSDLAELPPVLHAMATDVVAAVGAVDRSVVVLLEAARAITDEQWDTLERRGGRA